MFLFKKIRDMTVTIIHLNNRILELEEILCPCRQHDWVELSSQYLSCSDRTVITKMCRKCKRIEEFEVDGWR